MGNCCCHAASPCGSAEEISGLLKDDSKTVMPGGDRVVVGTFGPEGGDMRKAAGEAIIKAEVKAEALQVKQSPEKEEWEAYNTQENGPLQKEGTQTSALSPGKGPQLKENSTRAEDKHMMETPAGAGTAGLLQCTLNLPDKGSATADWEAFPATTAAAVEENLAPLKDSIPDPGASLAAESKDPPHTETDTAAAGESGGDNKGGSKVTIDCTVADPPEESPQHSDASSAPSARLAVAARQVSPVSAVSQEGNSESSCAATDDSESGSSSPSREADLEDRKSHDISESSGLDPTGRNRSGAERDSVREPAATPPADASESPKSNHDEEPLDAPLVNIMHDVGEEITLEVQSQDEDGLEAKSDETEEAEDILIKDVKQAGKEPQGAESPSTDVNAEVVPVRKVEDPAGDGLANSEEDLYRGVEEPPAQPNDKPGPPLVLATTPPDMEDRCSLDPAVDILSYSEREWRGNTAKSTLIRKGYKEMSQRFASLRRVRGDNYCALRATLFQVLAHSAQLPAWLLEDEVAMLPEELEAQEGLISQWTFPGECLQGNGTRDVTQQLKGYVELLQNKWRAAVDCSSPAERQQLCQSVFQGGEEELGLLEALKLLMLGRAVELHGRMRDGGDVPLFCWLLFARDSSDCPRAFLSNHLSHVGLSAGLEQVEMFLLGYALRCTIQVYRLYKADTEEFVTYYPDDHKDDWPSVCLVTEDDRHYNVPVAGAAEPPEEEEEELASS